MAQYRSYQVAKQAVSDIQFTQYGKFHSQSDFARKARYWSPATFNKRVRQARMNQRKRQARRELIEVGIAPGVADSLKHLKPKRIQKITGEFKQKRSGVPVKTRRDLWVEWAKREDYPDWIEKKAQEINAHFGENFPDDDNIKAFDPNDAYGWAIMYYSFMRDEDPKIIENDFKVDPHDGNVYMYARKTQKQPKA